MKIEDVEIYADSSNRAIVRMPNRSYLGSVIPGDVLFLMHGEAMDILEETKHNPGSYVYYKAHSIASALEQRLSDCIDVYKENDLELNFFIEVSVTDYDDPL